MFGILRKRIVKNKIGGHYIGDPKKKRSKK